MGARFDTVAPPANCTRQTSTTLARARTVTRVHTERAHVLVERAHVLGCDTAAGRAPGYRPVPEQPPVCRKWQPVTLLAGTKGSPHVSSASGLIEAPPATWVPRRAMPQRTKHTGLGLVPCTTAEGIEPATHPAAGAGHTPFPRGEQLTASRRRTTRR